MRLTYIDFEKRYFKGIESVIDTEQEQNIFTVVPQSLLVHTDSSRASRTEDEHTENVQLKRTLRLFPVKWNSINQTIVDVNEILWSDLLEIYEMTECE